MSEKKATLEFDGKTRDIETLTSFMWVAMDQLVSQLAKMKYMFGC